MRVSPGGNHAQTGERTGGFFRRIQSLWRDSPEARDGITEEPSEIRFRAWVLALALLAGPPLLFLFYAKNMFPGLTVHEALDFAQLGRNLSEGRGFVTFLLRPLALTHGANPMMQPDTIHGPLYPFLLALAFAIGGPKDTVVATVSGIFYFLTIPVLYFLGVRLFNRAVALLTALTYSFNALMLEYAASGMHITLFIFLMSCLLLTIYNLAVYARSQGNDATGGRSDEPNMPPSKFPDGKYALAGVLAGLLYLTDSVFFWIAPILILAVYSFTRERKWRAVVAFCVPMLLLMLPWMARNMAITGNPIFGLRGMEILMETKEQYPGQEAYRHFANELLPGVGVLQAVVQKILLGVGTVIEQFPQITASWVLAFFLPCLLFRFTDSATNILRRVMMYCFLGIMVGMLVFKVNMWMFVAFIPVMLLFSVAYLLELVKQAHLRTGSVALVVTLLSVAVLYPLVSNMGLNPKPASLKEVGAARALAEKTKKTDVVLSDQPWIVAWYADRPSVWIPVKDERITDIRTQFPQARWLFLTDQSRGFSDEWNYLYQVLASWNTQYMRAAENSKPKESIVLKGNEFPLLTALDGFTTVAPAKDTTPLVVVANVSDVNSNVGMLPGATGASSQ